MHVRYSANALIAFAILCGTGCNEAIYTLGRLPTESEKRNSCREIDDASAAASECVTKSNDAGGRIGSGGARAMGSGGSAGVSFDASIANGGSTGGTRPIPADDASDSCPNDARPAVRRGLSLYLLVDDSLSLVLQPAWNSLTLAINAFVDDPKNAGLGVGIGYYGSSCNGADYALPTVRVGPLPDVAPAIKASYPVPLSGKAITPALNGAVGYARALTQDDTQRDVAIVLVTDTIADPICPSTSDTAAQAVAYGLAASPPIRTYVIGLGAGPTLLDPVNLIDPTPLDPIAVAGGTKEVRRIEVNLSTNTELTTALNDLALAALPCAYEISAEVNADRAAIEWHPTGGAVVEWPRVPSESACGGKPGAFVRAEAPGYLELCPAACSLARATAPGAVWVRSMCR